jgi:hypothetical protein
MTGEIGMRVLSLEDIERGAILSHIRPWVTILSKNQFIGRHDENGKEIFEGDIVEHKNGIHVVVWDNDSYSFQMDLSSCVLDQEAGACDANQIEVIGNIYENPELLEKL